MCMRLTVVSIIIILLTLLDMQLSSISLLSLTSTTPLRDWDLLKCVQWLLVEW